MENKQDGITLFDTLFTNNHICMMKLLLPMLPPSQQKSIAIYIKYMELQYTLQYFTKHPYGLYLPSGQDASSPPDFNTLFETLLPYCTPREKEQFTQIRNMMNTFRSMQDMMEMMNMMKEMFPEGFADLNAAGASTGDFAGISPDMMGGLGSMLGDGDMGQIMNMLQMLRGGA